MTSHRFRFALFALLTASATQAADAPEAAFDRDVKPFLKQ